MRITLWLYCTLVCVFLKAQTDPRKEISKLCSESFHGRGYVKNGDRKAATYIASQFKANDLKAFGKDYFQTYHMQVNTFPGKLLFSADGKELEPGMDFLVKASSTGLKGKFEVFHLNRETLLSDSAFEALKRSDLRAKAVCLDTMTLEGELADKRYKFVQYNGLKAGLLIIKSKRNLLWTVAREQSSYTCLEVRPSAFGPEIQEVKVNIQAKLIPAYQTQNVIGYVPGTVYPDSFLVVTAHYDHLGRMGKATYFPGANDNASGTVMLLELMRHYAKNPLPMTVVFMAFSAEEAGLVGSQYFVNHPLFPLEKIRFLLNIDLAGTGADGITAVNGAVFTEEFELLKAINTKESLLKQVLPRDKAPNSDHYWFSENGVRAMFIYQMGEYGHYHDPGDRAEILPLTHFNPCMKLVILFLNEISN